ncbi:MAG: type II secretion system protein GspL [Woeseiaceae bacterium]
MTEFVVIRLGHDPRSSVEWIVADDNGTQRGRPQRGTLAEAAGFVQGRPVIVLVPSTEVLTTVVDLPVRSGARLNATIPFALEEQVAVDIETMHFAAGDKRESGLRPVAAVSRKLLDSWIALLGEAGMQAWKIIPEDYGLARIPGTMSILVDGDDLLFNDGADVEFSLDHANPSDALVAAGKLSDRQDDDHPTDPKGHLIVYCSAADEERFSHDWIALRHELHSVDINLMADGALPRLAVTVASGHGVNLLQGRYGPKADYGSWLRPWRTAAMLLLSLVVISFAGKGVDYYRLSKEEAVLQAQFNQEFQQIRPGNTREVLDPVAAVNSLKRGLGTSTASPVFLDSLRELAAAIRSSEDATVESLSYRAGVVDIRVTSADVETIGEIQKKIAASGQFVASIQSTDRVADRINSRIQIREAGS